MANNDFVGQIPKDGQGSAFERAMGVPVVSDAIAIGSAVYVDIFDLSQYLNRDFIGISVFNPSNSLGIYLAIGAAFSTNKCISVHPNGFLVFDSQSFGSGFMDPLLNGKAQRVRAKTSATTGTLAAMTIDYDNTGSPIQPTNGMQVSINGAIYEFSNDLSATPGDYYVLIGASADASWTNLKNAINANEQALTASINTTTNVVTLTSNYAGNSLIPVADGGLSAANPTGAVFSDATTTGGSGGITPIFHIW